MNAEERQIRNGRSNASQMELQAATDWVKWCSQNGWSDETLLPLEALWWKYHKPKGNR